MSYSRYTNKKPRQYEPQMSVIISPPDKTLLVVVAFLVILGLMAIFSASAPKCMDAGLNPAKFLLSQMVYLVVGYIGLKFLTNYDYKNLVLITTPLAFFVILFLILVNYTPLGVTVNEAKRWIGIGMFQFQPSEFAKPAVIMLLASAFYKNDNIMDNHKIVYYFLPILLMVFMIFKQPNLSMVILLMLTSLVMYLSAGGPLKVFVMGAGIGAFGLLTAGVTQLIKPYQMSRITTWLNPESDPLGAGYNVIQSMVAFATGGFWGVGYGSSKQKLAWLPESHTDFIFAVMAEELGFIGCLLVIGLFWTFIHRGFLIASRCPDMYGKLLAVGITFSIGFQAFLNMSVASSLLPATGVTLPFISYGGSSLMVSMWMVGILLNISKKRVKKIRVNANVRHL
ncbi:MAG TPA: putative lipid II flippase FtsW [Candidatus Gastranaerophilaceae bacterium]|nr:putative lipid II flippase FtsW [Candidatus Gastranaerophilaceae bacterium]HPT41306.1 putative lipid II flippase FtsW [Candidatus Gastranaerophilaceae bacterium]